MIRHYGLAQIVSCLIVDALAVLAAWGLALWLRLQVSLFGVAIEPAQLVNYSYALFGVVPIAMLANALAGLYRLEVLGDRRARWRAYLRGGLGGAAAVIVLGLMVRRADLSRGMLSFFAVFYLCLLIGGRTLALHLRRWWTLRRGRLTRVAIIGTGPLADRLVERLEQASFLPYELVGFVAVEPTDGRPPSNVLGDISQLRQILWQQRIEQVFIALPIAAMHRLAEILTLLSREHVETHFVPDVLQRQWLSSHISRLGDLPVVHLSETPTVGWQAAVKRAEDLLIAGLLLLLFGPLMLAIAAAVKLTSPGPALFRQERVGRNGRRFRMVKFRTMHLSDRAETDVFTRPDSPRITRVGHFLRRHMLDELPQLLNVLRGEMSVVGPRPERPWAVEQVREGVRRYMLKHKVKAGITGWAQVNGYRGEGNLDKRIHYDLFYIRHWSLWFDLRIMWMTLGEILRGRPHPASPALRRTARPPTAPASFPDAAHSE